MVTASIKCRCKCRTTRPDHTPAALTPCPPSAGLFMRHARRNQSQSFSERASENAGNSWRALCGSAFWATRLFTQKVRTMTNVIPLKYHAQTVRFSTDGWINATELAKSYGRRLDFWLKTEETQAYLESIGRYLNTSSRRDLIQTRRGKGGGTWLHPKLAVVFARCLVRPAGRCVTSRRH